MKIVVERTTYTNPEARDFNLHTHDYYEIYCFLRGDAKYFIDGNIYSLRPGDILFIKKSESHRLLLNSPIPYERIIITFYADALFGENANSILAFFDALPVGANNMYPAYMNKDKNWHYYINKMINTEDITKRRLYLSVLVTELYENYKKTIDIQKPKDVILDIINYINTHLFKTLSLEFICNEFYISKTHLNRKFRALTGSSAWEYITVKRLFAAKDMLQNGESPTKIFEKCGFNDYTTFFKAYKKKFGISPKYESIRNGHPRKN